MEDDGSRVLTDVLSAVIDEGEHAGTPMVLQPSQSWTKPSDGNHSYYITALSTVESNRPIGIMEHSLPIAVERVW